MINFVSYGFIFFVAGLLLIYYLLPERFRWIALLAGSVVFYAFAGLIAALVMFAVATVTYFVASGIGKEISREDVDADKKKKVIGVIFYLSAGFITALLIVSRITNIVRIPGLSFFALIAI